jgi:hypothetical protein
MRFFMIRSLTPPQAAGNALAFAVQETPYFIKDKSFGRSAFPLLDRVHLTNHAPDGFVTFSPVIDGVSPWC